MKAESFSEYGWRGVGTTSRKKQTCHCARVKYMTESRQEGRLVYCSFHSLGFEILLFESCFEGTYGCCCCFENRLIKVYLYT